MKKFACVLILSLYIFSAKVFAADIWFAATYSRDGEKYDWYVVTENIKENFDDKEFLVPVKIAYNGERSNSQHLHRFRLVDNVWFAKHKLSSNEFIPINSNEIYQLMFDACKPYCELAQIYPR